jgi:RNA polymerase sigma-70 factor (ECF subfamily)
MIDCMSGLQDAKTLPDEVIVALLCESAGSQNVNDLFAEIFDRYHTRVVNWCYGVARERELALDLAQEVFLKVFRSLHAFRGDSRVSTWIYVITRNHCLNALRRNDGEPSSFACEIPLNLAGDNGLNAHQALEDAESFRNFYRAISRFLTPLEIDVLWNRSGAKAFIVSAKRKLKLYLHNRRITSTGIQSLAA